MRYLVRVNGYFRQQLIGLVAQYHGTGHVRCRRTAAGLSAATPIRTPA